MKPRRLSYSSLSLFKKCRKAWAFRYVLEMKGLPSSAAERGKRLHLSAEKYLRGALPLDKLPIQYKPFDTQLAELKYRHAVPEQAWYAGHRWQGVLTEKEAAIMAVIDINYTPYSDEMTIIDIKSGRQYPEHDEQLELYAVMAAMRYGQLARVNVLAWYIDQGRVGAQKTHRREWLELLAPRWYEKMEEVWKAEAKHDFPPTVGRGCAWCPFRNDCSDGKAFLAGESNIPGEFDHGIPAAT